MTINSLGISASHKKKERKGFPLTNPFPKERKKNHNHQNQLKSISELKTISTYL